MQDRALSLDPEQVAAFAALHHEPLGGAGEEIGHDGVHREPPAGDCDPGLARGDEDGLQAALARFEVELAGCGHLADRAVRPDGQHDRRVHLEVLSGGGAEIGRWFAQVSELHPVLRRELGQPRNVVEANVQAVLEVEPVRDARLQEFLPVTGKVAALRDDADECRIRVVGQRVLDRVGAARLRG